MNIELTKIVIRKVNIDDIDEMIHYRIDCLTEMQGKSNQSSMN